MCARDGRGLHKGRGGRGGGGDKGFGQVVASRGHKPKQGLFANSVINDFVTEREVVGFREVARLASSSSAQQYSARANATNGSRPIRVEMATPRRDNFSSFCLAEIF